MNLKILFFLSVLLSCKNNSDKTTSKAVNNKKESFIVRMDSINEEFLKRVVYDTAIYYNNLPTSNILYNLNEIYPIHFRLNLSRFYSKSDFKKAIPIKETTWEFDEENFITVWYRMENGKFTPFDTYIYGKSVVF